MKRLIELSVWLGVGLVLGTTVSADDAVVPGGTYTSIAQRNVFGLIPPVVATVAAPPVKPPPKITLNGITSLFGRLQVLFKVHGAEQPGQPPRENAYLLDENESQDDVMVMHIDAQAEMVTFNNHGIVQEIPLANRTTAAASRLVINEPLPIPEVTLPKTYPPEFIRAHTPEYLGGSPGATTNAEPMANTTLEQRIILIEAQRAYLKSRNDPAADELPLTALTPPEDGPAKGR